MMLSQSMHQYAPSPHFQPLPSSSSDIDAAAGMSHLSMPASSHKQAKQSRHHPYDAQQTSSGRISRGMNGSSGPIRRRISRACDQCNQLRTKCDGKQPCQHCVDFTLKCEYARERKKRGKASRKDLQAAAAAAAAGQNGMVDGGADHMRMMGSGMRRDSDLPPPPRPGSVRKSSSAASSRTSLGELHDLSQMHHHHLQSQSHHHHHHMQAPDSPSMQLQHDGVGGIPMHFDRMSPFHQQSPGGLPVGSISPQSVDDHTHYSQQPVSAASNGYPQNDFLVSPHHQAPPLPFPNGVSPISGLLSGQSPEEPSPAWIPLPSPPPQHFNPGIRYPVLAPLLPSIAPVIPATLACDLLDLYFTNPSTSFFQPASPYVLTHVFRRQSFLHPTNPRPTSPSLLCAMLWVAAQTCDAPFLTATPTARGRVCQRLLELCISLLRPLVHVSFTAGQPGHGSAQDSENGTVGIGLGGLGGGHAGAAAGRDGGVGAAGTLDDVLTYAHLGIVISASEFKAASLRWWHSAWTLARELKLNREVGDLDDEVEGRHSPGESGGTRHARVGMGEEEREERRRTWWLLYIVDRHLALCYNRPLHLLDVECAELYVPMDDVIWQNGQFYATGDSTNLYAQGPVSPNSGVPSSMNRSVGVTFEVTGCGLFQFFLPLMTILGEVVDLHHERNRPKFGMGRQAVSGRSDQDIFALFVEQITAQLDAYQRSLQEFEAANIRPHERDADGKQDRPQLSEAEIQAKIAVSYGTHVMHVLHILISGKWDPISMLDDNDLWISSNSFISSTAHAVSAAEAIGNILKYDPDLSFMPYFFGIYLLQGSFLLLLIADKLQGEASEAVVTACETIVRAHEVCVVTLNTEYQRNFRKVMRSALNQVRGRGAPEDIDEQKLQRRQVLQLYRWCGNGTGLAL